MTDLHKAAQQALEALEWHYRQGHSNTLGGFRLKIDEKALRNLRAALAQQAEPVQLRELLIQAASMAVAAERAGKYGGASWVADAVLEDCPKQQAEPVEPVASTWRSVLPGGKRTDEWESARIADYNAGWNAYRKAATSALEKLWDNNLRPVVEFRGRRMTPEGTRECWGVLLCDVKQDPPEGAKLYTAPPQRKPLTKEEIMRAFYAAEKTPMSIRHGLSVVEAARIVEKAHGIGETK